MEYDIKKNSQIVIKNMLFNMIGKVLPLFVGVFCIPFIIKGLGAEQFGLLSIIWVFILNYFPLIDIGLGSGTTKFVAMLSDRDKDEDLTELLVASFSSAFIISLVGMAISLFLMPFLATDLLKISDNLKNIANQSFLIISFSIPFIVINSIGRGVLEGLQRYDILNFIKIVFSSLLFLVPLFCVLAKLNIVVISVFFVIVQLIGVLIYIYYCFKLVPFCKKKLFKFNLRHFLYLFSFGKWLTINRLSTALATNIDRFLIGIIISVSMIGFYTAPFDAITRTLFLSESLSVLFPVFSRLGRERKDENFYFYKKTIRYVSLIMGLVTLFVFFFSKDILLIWLGPEFAEKSNLVLKLLSIGVFSFSLSIVGENLINGLGFPKIIAKLRLIELPFYIIGCLFMISKFSINGAAFMWSARLIIDSVLIILISKKMLFLGFKELINNLGIANNVPYLLFVAVLIFLEKMIFRNFLIVFPFSIITILISVFLWRDSIFDKYDVNLFKSCFIKK